MMSHERAEQQPARLPFLVAKFRKAIEAQQRRDAEWIATFERVSRNPRVRQIIREIVDQTT